MRWIILAALCVAICVGVKMVVEIVRADDASETIQRFLGRRRLARSEDDD